MLIKNIKIITLNFIIFFLIFLSNSFSDEKTVKTDPIISKINDSFLIYKNFKGDFILKKGKRVEKGKFTFKEPNRIKLVFSENAENQYTKRIISNGKRIWIYIPDKNLVLDQNISQAEGIELSSSKLGIRKLIRTYSIDKISDNQTINDINGKKIDVCLIELKSKSTYQSFSSLSLYVSKSDGFIIRIDGIKNNNEPLTFIRGNIIIDNSINDKEFELVPPEDVKLIKDPIYSKGDIYGN